MRVATPKQYEWEGWGESTASIVLMGLALAIAGLVQTLAMPAAQPVVALELFVSFLVPTGLATGGYWLASRNVSPDVRWRVATWVSVGIVAACGLGGWLVLYVALEGGTIHDPLSLVTTLAAVGGATGFVAAVHVTPQTVTANSTAATALERETDSVGKPPRTDDMESETDQNDDSASTAEQETDTASTTEDETGTASAAEHEGGMATETTGSTATGFSAVAVPESVSGRPAAADETAMRTEPAAPSERDVPDDSDAMNSSLPALEPGVETVTSIPSTTETILEVLRDERARIVLAFLYHDCGGTAQSIGDLARVVADHTDQPAGTAAVSLRHSTLPKLETIRAIDWDPYADRVSAPEHAVFEEGVRDASVLLESFEPGTR